jgi:hypothetical protein
MSGHQGRDGAVLAGERCFEGSQREAAGRTPRSRDRTPRPVWAARRSLHALNADWTVPES